MITITPIAAFSDNYIWHLQRGGEHWVVDPGDARPVIAALGPHPLAGILITHHHLDHTGGVAALAERYHCPVYGPASIPGVTHPLAHGDRRELLGLSLSVLDVPGHTLDHIALLLHEGGEPDPQLHLFCGDTLFAGGCGRLFEGSASQMATSLARLAALPPSTLVYCAHEYTQANLRFAQAVEPDNPALTARMARVAALRAAGEPSLPSTIGEELATNPFLRCAIPEVRERAIQRGAAENSDETAIFACLRQWKDNF